MKTPRNRGGSPRRGLGEGGFTLLELLVVIGLIAALAFFVAGGLTGGGQSAALQAGQAGVTNLLAAARTRAVATGNPTRVLVHHDAQSPRADERYLRFLALEEWRNGSWETLQTAVLPAGIYILPHQNATPANLFGGAPAWVKLDGTRLHSSCLSRPLFSRAVDNPLAENWVDLTFTPQGTTGTSGLLVLAPARRQPPGSIAAGESPVVFENQDTVRGFQLSAYGVTLLINDRRGF